MAPHVNVLMPVFNGESHVREAIESILGQTFADFELILVEDGSTDRTLDILRNYARRDLRVVLLENGSNQGLVYSLNRGLSLARGKYIARMDADDISLPDRLQRQVEYMESHPEVGVLGTNIAYIDDNGHLMYGGRPKDKRPESPKVIEWLLMWRCCIYHPTVMIRRAILEHTGFIYDPTFEPAEDRELWVRLSKHTVIAKLPEVLLHYRISAGSISRVRAEEQRRKGALIVQRELAALLGEQPSKQAVEILIGGSNSSSQRSLSSEDFDAAADLLIRAYQRFCQRPLSEVDREQIEIDVADRLASIAVQASNYSAGAACAVLWRLWRFSPTRLLSLGVGKRAARIPARLLRRI